MKPKKIRVTKTTNPFLEKGEVYEVTRWVGGTPEIKLNLPTGGCTWANEKWEPVQEFNHGDPVWAWDEPGMSLKCRLDDSKRKRFFVGMNPKCPKSKYVVVNDHGSVGCFTSIEHRKPQMTLKQLADKADVNLDEVEIVE